MDKVTIKYSLLFLFLLIGCTTANEKQSTPPSHEPASVQTSPAREIVVTYQQVATDVGYEILKNGGNAFDAFVAATAVQYILAPGVTSFSGPLGALVYDARSKKVIYLDATLNDAFDSRHKWDAKNPQFGTAALVPGAVAGLEAISKKYGSLSFAKVLEPAITLAYEGFALDSQYAGILRATYGQNLKRSPYALKTYFKDGQPLQKGDTLKQPVVAQFLRKLAAQGSRYVYRGDWMKQCIKAVNAEGGHLQTKDFHSYKADWSVPVKIGYRGYNIYSPEDYGGINTLMSLKVLEHANMEKYGPHYSKNAEGLATMGVPWATIVELGARVLLTRNWRSHGDVQIAIVRFAEELTSAPPCASDNL